VVEIGLNFWSIVNTIIYLLECAIVVKRQASNDDDVRFVLDQHGWLDFYSTSLMKQFRYVAPIGHVILIAS